MLFLHGIMTHSDEFFASKFLRHEEEHRRREEEMIRHREQEELRRQQEGFKPNYMENVSTALKWSEQTVALKFCRFYFLIFLNLAFYRNWIKISF